jgi:hypothetical protein
MSLCCLRVTVTLVRSHGCAGVSLGEGRLSRCCLRVTVTLVRSHGCAGVSLGERPLSL